MPPHVIVVNSRTYAWPKRPLVVICCDGSEPAYIEHALAAGVMPSLEKVLAKGVNLRAQCVIPSFTNPNNVSIATGQPPKVHGISGNFFFDQAKGEEVLMNDPRFLRAPTIFGAFQSAGARVAIVTAKDKLRNLLGAGLDMGSGSAVCFSAENANETTKSEHGIANVAAMVGLPVPEIYSLEISEFVFAAGVGLMATFKPDLMYLATTDYIQHKFSPGTAKANAFYAMMDRYIDRLDATGAVVIVTADHGMTAKHLPDGSPDVLYLQDYLDELVGPDRTRVILPITDPYTLHHGALGSFATIYVEEDVGTDAIIAALRDLPGMIVLGRQEACDRLDLPGDRIGEIVAISAGTKVIGTKRDRHDLSGLTEPLRSHGGLDEQTVPFIANVKFVDLPSRLHNYDVFDIGLNHVA